MNWHRTLLLVVVCAIIHISSCYQDIVHQKPQEVDPSATDLLKEITWNAGYLPVNATNGAQMFYWFFPSMDKNVSAPLILWLQGGTSTSLTLFTDFFKGPGCSGMMGLFYEVSTFRLQTCSYLNGALERTISC